MKKFEIECHEPSFLPEGKTWKLAWNDEFDGDALDESKWDFRLNFWGKPFEGYTCIGMGHPGEETGGSFVKIDGELHFVCGNSFSMVSDYRIYRADGMHNAHFDFPDGGFRGWGTVIPVRQGSCIRYYWLTFDRHNGSDYNWSYGNFYCFEAR